MLLEVDTVPRRSLKKTNSRPWCAISRCRWQRRIRNSSAKNKLHRDLLEKERDIQRERALGEGKPEKMVDKIAEGRMSKFYEEVCLLEQPFIRENTISVGELIRAASAKLGETIRVARFVRYKVGDAADVPGVQESPLPVTA